MWTGDVTATEQFERRTTQPMAYRFIPRGYAAQKLFRCATLGVSLGATTAVYEKDKEYLRTCLSRAVKVAVPSVLVGGLWAWVHNRPFLNRNTMLNSAALSLLTFSFFVYRKYLERSQALQIFLLPRDHIFYQHALSAGAGGFTLCIVMSCTRVSAFASFRTGYVCGPIIGFLMQCIYEWGQFRLNQQFRKQAVRLHFPTVAQEDKASGKWVALQGATEAPLCTPAHAAVQDFFKDAYDTFIYRNRQILELQLEQVDNDIYAQNHAIAELDQRLAELRTELGYNDDSELPEDC